jgi:hypothetical protein
VLYRSSLAGADRLRRDEMTFVEVNHQRGRPVMQVKARESPATLDESMVLTMSLSAAKTWRFQAARKDGKAVKYRQVLSGFASLTFQELRSR